MSITLSIMQISQVVKAHPRKVFKEYWFRGPDLVAFESNLDPSCSPKAFPTQDSPNINHKRDPDADQFYSGIVIGLRTLCDEFRCFIETFLPSLKGVPIATF